MDNPANRGTKTPPTTLRDAVLTVLVGAEKPLRAVDIVRALAALPNAPFPADKSAVNKVLYASPATFERVGEGGTPVWRALSRPAAQLGLMEFQVDGVGAFSLEPSLSDQQLAALIEGIDRALTPEDGSRARASVPTLHCDPSLRRVVAAAENVGLAVSFGEQAGTDSDQE